MSKKATKTPEELQAALEEMIAEDEAEAAAAEAEIAVVLGAALRASPAVSFGGN